MRRFLLYGVIFLAVLSVPVRASVTVDEVSEPEYLINSGYSQAVAEDVFVTKNRATGKPIEPLYETSSNRYVRWWKTFWAYLDPARDEVDRIHHDIELTPSYKDL